MDNTIAIDVVFLPELEMMERCYQENAELLKKQRGPHEFHPIHCVPHGSLVMSGIRANALLQVQSAVQRIAERTAPLSLTARLTSHPIPNGSSVSEFTIDRTPEIVDLHEKTLAAMLPHRVPNAPLESLHQPPAADPITLGWLNNFMESGSHDNYAPHLTLGFGEQATNGERIPFTARTIAVFQLGNYCTCRRLFSSYPLQGIKAS